MTRRATDLAAARLSFFTRAPEHAVELDEFERIGLLRLKVLCALSAWHYGGSERDLLREIEALDAFQELFGDDGEHAVDTIAHYALRLAFCKYVTRTVMQLACCLSLSPHGYIAVG